MKEGADMKKNKNNIADQRKKEKLEKQEKFRKIMEEKKAEELARHEREMEKKLKERMSEKLTKNDKVTVKKKYSGAKASGLKSTFAIDGNKVLMTSFGNGNDAIPEKLIENGVITDYENNLEVRNLTTDFSVKRINSDKLSVITNPNRKDKIGKDMLDRKDVLEQKFYGELFDDNIHIQLIYNIMDIEKIMSIHINNILYGLNNLLYKNNTETKDLVGVLRAKAYDEFCEKDTEKYIDFKEAIENKQLQYYGTAFYKTGFDTKAKISKSERRDEKDIYYIISALSVIRQFLAHEKDDNRNDEYGNSQVALYTFDEEYDDLYKNTLFRKEEREVLDSLYNERISALNESFLDNAKKDLTILFRAYEIKDHNSKLDFIRKYYDFVVRKEYKHAGFSLKQLREFIICGNKEIADEKYNEMRSRINRLFDFVVYTYYENHPEQKLSLIKKLRASSDQNDKNHIYIDEAVELWKNIRDIIENSILSEMNGDNLNEMIADDIIAEISIEDLSNQDWNPIDINSSYFSKIIYLLTLFLDGKEINDLVTTLINKFENIASFNAVLASINDNSKLKREYSLFSNSKEISHELRTLNSFARMEKPSASSTKEMFIEAAQLLGDKGSEKELGMYFDTLLDKNCSTNQKGFRNYIRNNVVKSSRFKYLIRYCNIEAVQMFSGNKHLVGFVMESITKEQILRYYKSCVDEYADIYKDTMRSELTDIIVNMSFEKLKSLENTFVDSTPGQKDKILQQKNIIRLYLTVCYLFFKNLINVNSRYFLAFYFIERDFNLWNIQRSKGIMKYTVLTKKFLDESRIRQTPKTKKITDVDGNVVYVTDNSKKLIPSVYLKTNLDNADDRAIHQFRNSAEHLNALRNSGKYLSDIESVSSYFEIYHYITQRYIMDEMIKNEKKDNGNPPENSMTTVYFDNVKKYNTYSKDFVKALCVPFGYNLARFKNLSIDRLFDMNYKPENREIETKD